MSETSPNHVNTLHWHAIGQSHQSLGRTVIDRLRELIVQGEIEPGFRLIADDLAEEFEVSRGMVREALLVLATEGFVEIEPRRGTRVAIFSGKQADDLFEIRKSLEGLVAALAAQRRTEDQLADLRIAVAHGLHTAQSGNLNELPLLNTRFHNLLATAAGNEFLVETLNRLSKIIEWVYARRIIQRSAQSWEEHLRIVDAIADRDPERAMQAAHEHITRAWVAYQSPT